jgi:penicillin-binding protein 1A
VLTVILRFFQLLGTLILIGAVTASFVACYAAVYIKNAVIPEASIDLTDYAMNENSVIYYYDDYGRPVELATLVGSENREWVDYEDIPQDLVDAFVSIEDERFWQHQGVDWYRTAGAFVNMFLGMRNNFGGSTITQQLIKNTLLSSEQSYKRKIQEAYLALQLETTYSKDEILECYLNTIWLGESYYGVQTAAEGYFGKQLHELTLRECAILAGTCNSPYYYNPRRNFYTREKEGVDYRLLLMPDHGTTLCTRTHDAEPIPYALYDSTCKREGEPRAYSETSAKTSDKWIDDGYTLIYRLLQRA